MSRQPTVNRSTSIFENEKKFRKGEKFEPKKTKGEKFRDNLNKSIKESEFREKKDRPKKLKSPDVSGPEKMKDNMMDFEKSLKNLENDPRSNLAKGGRAMYKSGMRVCKLAKRGKGRAYGKNS